MKNSTKFYLLLSFFSAAFIVAVNESAPTPPNHFIEGWVTRYQHNAGDHANHNTWYGHYGLLTISALNFIGGITRLGYGFANMLVYVIGFPLVSFVLTAFAFKEKPDWILPIITGFIGLVVCLGLASIDSNLLVEVLSLGYWYLTDFTIKGANLFGMAYLEFNIWILGIALPTYLCFMFTIGVIRRIKE